jgi:RNA-directed DNA polymerase
MRAETAAIEKLAAQLGIDDIAELSRIVENPEEHYTRVPRKKRDGTRRMLLVPDERLKRIQRKVLDKILSNLSQHPCSHCRPRYSILTNARAHIGKAFVSVCDLARCFPSIKPRHVAEAFRLNHIDEEFIRLLVCLCTFRQQLPQGAPTSTAVLNAVLYPLDEQLSMSASRRGITYSRYVDDLTFSANYSPRSFVRRAVRSLVREAGFRLAEHKSRHWGRRQLPVVTGIAISKTLGPQRQLVRAVERYIGRLEHGAEINPNSLRRLLGQIVWIHGFWPRKAAKLYDRLRVAIPIRLPPRMA